MAGQKINSVLFICLGMYDVALCAISSFHWFILLCILYLNNAENHKIFSQLSAALTSVQLITEDVLNWSAIL